MLAMVVALHCEAKPLIDTLSLKRSLTGGNFELFSSDKARLVISGIGKVRAAIATSTILSSIADYTDCILVNFGICGNSPAEKIGQALLINQIVDNSSGKAFHPDILMRHPFKERALRTFDAPQDLESLGSNSDFAVDMEGSGVFEAASLYLPPSQIQIIKIVSDHFDKKIPSKDFVTDLISQNVPDILRYVEDISTILSKTALNLSPEEQELINQVTSQLKLTQYQSIEIIKLAKGYKVSTGKDLASLNSFLEARVSSKGESKRKFEEIRSALTPS